MSENIKTTLTEQWTSITNWSGSMNEAGDLLNAAFRYTELDAEKITTDHLNELSAIISGVRRLLREVETEMDEHNNELVERIDGDE